MFGTIIELLAVIQQLEEKVAESKQSLRAENERLENRLSEIMPLFEEARDALPALSLTSAKLHRVDLTLADRMDAVGMRDWRSV